MGKEKESRSFNKCLLSTYYVPGSSRDLEKKGLGQTGIVPAKKDLFSKQALQGAGAGDPLPCKVEGLVTEAEACAGGGGGGGGAEAGSFSHKYGQSRCGMAQPRITSSSARICTIS